MRADDHSTIGALIFSVLTPAIFWNRARAAHRKHILKILSLSPLFPAYMPLKSVTDCGARVWHGSYSRRSWSGIWRRPSDALGEGSVWRRTTTRTCSHPDPIFFRIGTIIAPFNMHLILHSTVARSALTFTTLTPLTRKYHTF